MPQPSSVVITRVLHPKRRADVLRRPRLLDFLHEHIDRKLILVSAAAGYGKTSLLVDFAHDTDLPICWYTLSETDRDLRIFVEYLIASVRQQFPGFGQRTEAYLASISGANIDPGSTASILVNDLYHDIPDYFVLVLDDYHRGEDESINFFLDTLLQNLPDNCHIILASRTIPRFTPKGMALMAARREIEGLGTNDLRFDPAEISSLLAQNYNQHIPVDQAETLAREAEGWITGILLTTHSMWKGLFASLIEARGTGSKIYDYLANEVYNIQTPDVQDFLRRTAILDEMTPSLCNRLLSRRDGRAMLALLEERNLFVSHVERDGDPSYRYHNLFQQFLKAKTDEAGDGQELHARAAALLEADGDWPEAIAHYQAAQRHREAARVIGMAAPALFERNHWQTLASWVDALPADVQMEYPRLLCYRATIHTQMGRIDQALAVFDQAYGGFKQRHDAVGMAEVMINRAMPLRVSGRLQDAQTSCQEALTLLGDKQASQALTKSKAEACRTIGICEIQLGRLDKGTEELRRSLALYEEIGDKFGTANLHSDLGTALRMVGNMTASDIHFERAVTLWNDLGATVSLANTLNNVGLGYHLRGEFNKAIEVYERALAIAQETAMFRVQAIVLAGLGDVYRDLGHFDQAFAAYNEARPIAERASEAWLVSYILDALGQTYILTGDYVRAGELIRQAYDQARERRSRQAATLYFASLGVLAYERGEPKTAITHLTEAVAVLQEIGARRDLPKVRLHLAHAHYLNGQWNTAIEALEAVMADVTALGYDQFLEPIARRMKAFLHFALRQNPDNVALAGFVGRVEQAAPTSVPETAPSMPAAAPSATLRIYGFGEVRVLRGSQPVDQRDWGTARAREMLFYLLSYPHRSKEQIGSIFWPDLTPAKVRSAFHVTVYRLRRALNVPDCILFDNDRYYFNQNTDYWYDVQEFDRLLAQAARVKDRDQAAYEACLQDAVALYRGDYLESLSLGGAEWQAAQAETLRDKYIASLLELADLAANRGDFARALDCFRRVARKDSFREVAHRGIMDSYRHMGDRNAALRHFHEFESHLQNELGVAPTAETMHLYEEILNGGG